jgi:SsrA-binding protein
MAKHKQGKATSRATIVVNKKARHDYFIEETLEAGLALQGWEVKSLRDGRVQLREAYVVIKDGEAWLLGAHITPLPTASTHIHPDPTRTRKLLMHRREIDRLAGAIDRQGYTLTPLRMFWSRGKAKLEIGTARGKKQHDKRATERERDWQREKARLLKHN